MENVKLGISPINWINDDVDDIGDFYDLETVLRDMRDLGFAATEMGRKYPRDATVLRPLLERYGLVLSGAWKTVQFSSGWNPTEDVAAFHAHVQFLQQMGSTHVVVCDGGGSLHWDARGPRSQIEKFSDAAWRRLASGLEQAGAYALEHDIQLVYHPHFGTGVETPAEIERLLAETNPQVVSLLADTGHIYVCGGNPAEVMRRHSDRIAYVHAKDVREGVLGAVRAKGTLFIDAVRQGMFTTPGDGCIDFQAVIDVLKSAQYAGWIILEAEQDPIMAEPVHLARAAKQYLSQLLGAKEGA